MRFSHEQTLHQVSIPTFILSVPKRQSGSSTRLYRINRLIGVINRNNESLALRVRSSDAAWPRCVAYLPPASCHRSDPRTFYVADRAHVYSSLLGKSFSWSERDTVHKTVCEWKGRRAPATPTTVINQLVHYLLLAYVWQRASALQNQCIYSRVSYWVCC